MIKLLLLTDFSTHSIKAAEYCYNLASQIRADLILCNIVTIPADGLLASTVVWPVYDHEHLMADSEVELKKLIHYLSDQNTNDEFKPGLSAINKSGSVANTVSEVAGDLRIDMIVMGTHTANGLTSLMFGDHAEEMIDVTRKPLLLVPGNAEVRPIKKIAYATDLAQLKDDLAAIFHLISIAKVMNAELLIVHTDDNKHTAPAFKKPLDGLLLELSNKADHANIYYRIVQSRDPETGLDWLCEHGQIDILAMLHRPKSFIEGLFKNSCTKKMAEHISIPLMVFPQGMS